MFDSINKNDFNLKKTGPPKKKKIEEFSEKNLISNSSHFGMMNIKMNANKTPSPPQSDVDDDEWLDEAWPKKE